MWFRKDVPNSLTTSAVLDFASSWLPQVKITTMTVANRAIFMDAGQIIQENAPVEFFNNLRNKCT